MILVDVVILVVIIIYLALSMIVIWHLQQFSLPKDASRWVVPLYEITSLILISAITILYLISLYKSSP